VPPALIRRKVGVYFGATAIDIIFIREFRADAWIGVYEWEQQQPQTLEFDLDIGLDTHRAGASDKIHDTIDYGKVVERVRADLKGARFKLLEALAEHVVQVLFHDFNAQWVKISVAKIGHMRGVRKVGVTIARSRHDPTVSAANVLSEEAPHPPRSG
jgi:dihydroneopterin aldolase